MPGQSLLPVIGRTLFTGQDVYGYRNGDRSQPITDPNDPWLWLNNPPQGPRPPTQGEADQTADDQRYQDILGIYRGAADLAHNQFNQQGDYLHSTIGEVNQLGNAGRQRILDREQRQLAGVGSSLRSRGLGNTTVLDNARRGVGADTNRALTENDEMVGSMRVGARNRLSDFMAGRTQAETGLQLAQAEPRQRRSDIYHALQMARIAAAAQGRGGNSALGAILPIAGGILGGIFGGPGGAAIGGTVGSGFNQAFGQR